MGRGLKFAIFLLLLLVIGGGVALFMVYQDYQRKINKPDPMTAVEAYLEALHAGDADTLFDLTKSQRATYEQVLGGSQSSPEERERILEDSKAKFVEKFNKPIRSKDAVLAFERYYLPANAEIGETSVNNYATEVREQVGDFEEIELRESQRVSGQMELRYVRVVYPKGQRPTGALFANPGPWRKRRIGAVVIEFRVYSFNTSPDYYEWRKWFRENEESLGGLPGFQMFKDAKLLGDSWVIEVNHYVDHQKIDKPR